jgi:hypothetical protein
MDRQARRVARRRRTGGVIRGAPFTHRRVRSVQNQVYAFVSPYEKRPVSMPEQPWILGLAFSRNKDIRADIAT